MLPLMEAWEGQGQMAPFGALGGQWDSPMHRARPAWVFCQTEQLCHTAHSQTLCDGTQDTEEHLGARGAVWG